MEHNSLIFMLTLYVSGQVLSAATCPKDCLCRWNRKPHGGYGKLYWVSCCNKNFTVIPDLTSLLSKRQPILLHLSGNRIKCVRNSDFPPGLSVVKLNLNSNQAVQIERDSFVNIANTVKYLNVEKTDLQFDRNVSFLRNLHRLEKLKMGGNTQKYTTLPSRMFISFNLSSLHEIYLNRCQLKNIAYGAFKGVHLLEVLDLTSNDLQAIPAGIRDLTNLRTLNLRLNIIRNIPTGIFRNLHNLENLLLDGNNPLLIHHGAFSGLEKSLKELSLDNCG